MQNSSQGWPFAGIGGESRKNGEGRGSERGGESGESGESGADSTTPACKTPACKTPARKTPAPRKTCAGRV